MDKKKRYKLKDLKVSEVAVCGKGMNPEAIISFSKSSDEDICKSVFTNILAKLKLEKKYEEAFDNIWRYNSALRETVRSVIFSESTEKEKDVKKVIDEYINGIKELFDSVEKSKVDTSEVNTMDKDVQKNVDELAIAKAMETMLGYPVVVAKAMLEFSDEERAYLKSLSADDQVKFVALSKEQRTEKIAEMKKSDEVIEVAGVILNKSKVDSEVLAVLKTLNDANEKQKDLLLKAQEDAKVEKAQRELVECIAKAEREYPNVPGESTDKGRLLQDMKKMSEDSQKTLMDILKKADEAFSIHLESGPAAILEKENTPAKQLDKLVQEYAKANSVSTPVAYSEVLKSAQGKALYKQTI